MKHVVRVTRQVCVCMCVEIGSLWPGKEAGPTTFANICESHAGVIYSTQCKFLLINLHAFLCLGPVLLLDTSE